VSESKQRKQHKEKKSKVQSETGELNPNIAPANHPFIDLDFDFNVSRLFYSRSSHIVIDWRFDKFREDFEWAKTIGPGAAIISAISDGDGREGMLITKGRHPSIHHSTSMEIHLAAK
jgi:hypothetical protein